MFDTGIVVLNLVVEPDAGTPPPGADHPGMISRLYAMPAVWHSRLHNMLAVSSVSSLGPLSYVLACLHMTHDNLLT